MFGRKQKIYLQILENMTDGVYLVDENREIRFWNKTAEALTGFTARDMTGSSINGDNIKYEDYSGKDLQPFEYPVALCFQEKKLITKNFFIKGKDDLKIPVEENAMPLLINDKVEGAVVTFKDISKCIQTTTNRLKSERKERLIPICGWCKKIRSDENYWEQLESFLTREGFGIFTHGMCPACSDKIFEKKIYLESYQKICREISGSISLDEVLQLIVKNVVKVMSVKASLVRLINKETRQLEIAAYYGLSDKYANKGPVAYDQSIDDALEGKPVSVYDITEHQDSRYYRETVEEGIRRILSIPLLFQKEVIGMLRMYTAEPVEYTDEDLKFITALAEQAAIAIVNARRFETAVSSEKEYLRVFEEITKAISSTLDVKKVMKMIVNEIPKVMNLKAATIRLLDHTGENLILVAANGLSQKYLDRGPIDTEENVRDALNEKPVAIYDVATDDSIKYRKEADEEGIKSILTVPVIARDKVLGILRLLSTEHREFSRQEIDFVASLAEVSGIAIENATMYEKSKSEYDNIMKYLDGAVLEQE